MEQLTGPRPYVIYIYKEEREYINSYEEDDIVFIPDEELFNDIDFENDEQEEEVLKFLNSTDFQKAVVIRRGKEIPSWAIVE